MTRAPEPALTPPQDDALGYQRRRWLFELGPRHRLRMKGGFRRGTRIDRIARHDHDAIQERAASRWRATTTAVGYGPYWPSAA